MKPEMIELYRTVQGRRGEWQVGDRGLDTKYGTFTVTWLQEFGMEVLTAYENPTKSKEIS